MLDPPGKYFRLCPTKEVRLKGAYYIKYASHETDENGNTVEEISGYYVVMFSSSTDNNFTMSNVRHILASFEGGTTDSTTGVTTYTDAEKDAARAKLKEAAELLAKVNVDGGLIGGASLKTDKFTAIVKAAN